MSTETFKIKTEAFEGPLDLLLSLIEKKKLFINDIALAKVADDYIAYLQGQEQFPIAQRRLLELGSSADCLNGIPCIFLECILHGLTDCSRADCSNVQSYIFIQKGMHADSSKD